MFGDKNYPVVKASEIIKNLQNGVSPSARGIHQEKVLTLSAVTQGTFDPTAWKDGSFESIPPSAKRVSVNAFYICRGNGNKTLVGTGVYALRDYPDLVYPDTVIAAEINPEKILLPFLAAQWKMDAVREQIEEEAKTTNGTYKINQKAIENIQLIVPPLSHQAKFCQLHEQSDKSKFAVQIAIYRDVRKQGLSENETF